MATKMFNYTEITTNDETGEETGRKTGQQRIKTCDFCGEKMKGIDYLGHDRCTGCWKDVCYSCEKLRIPQSSHRDAERFCPDCVKGKEQHIEAIKISQANQKDAERKLSECNAAYENAVNAFKKFDAKYQNDPKYMDAKKKFQELQAQVENGDYKSHRDMIRKYNALLNKVPVRTSLYEEIDNEIEAHKVDAGL